MDVEEEGMTEAMVEEELGTTEEGDDSPIPTDINVNYVAVLATRCYSFDPKIIINLHTSHIPRPTPTEDAGDHNTSPVEDSPTPTHPFASSLQPSQSTIQAPSNLANQVPINNEEIVLLVNTKTT
ncbi:hypothetical protein PIB30_013303 [Stylosanthes scabra]|uniref:Uncharacterized protein n=1 Tax=Stylosanthes scabra TaxID=79078 RepID=A0ABU6T630_9FABA|nr:hypothetical protein [Stylosanthes scabra]